MQRTADWKAIYDTPLMDVGSCHTHCGGYCCKNFYASDFNILSSNEVVLPMIDSEFEYLMSLGGMEGISDGAHSEEFSPVPGHTINLWFMKCTAQGLCHPHCHRPFVCRLYPYLPLIDYEGNITGFDYSALVDLFYTEKEQHPCWLVTQQEAMVQRQLLEALQPLIRNPEMIFILKASALVIDSLRKKVTGTFDPKDDVARKAFLKHYEYEVFTRSPWRTKEFKREIADIYLTSFDLKPVAAQETA